MSYVIDQYHFPSRQVYLNSAYADAYGGVPSQRSWCYFIFKEPIINLPSSYDCLISLNQATIPVSYFVVNSTNNVFLFQITNNSVVTNYSITVPIGNYSYQDLVSYLTDTNAKLVSGPSISFTLTTIYSETSNKFSFLFKSASFVMGNCNVYIKYSSVGSGYTGSKNSIFGFSGNAIFKGYNSSSSLDANGNLVLSSDIGVDLAGTRCIYVKLMNIHTLAYDSKTKYSGSTLARIPINQEPNGLVYWDNHTNFKSFCSIKNLSTLEIQVTDENGTLMDFNTIDWSLCLTIDVLAESPTEYKPDKSFMAQLK